MKMFCGDCPFISTSDKNAFLCGYEVSSLIWCCLPVGIGQATLWLSFAFKGLLGENW